MNRLHAHRLAATFALALLATAAWSQDEETIAATIGRYTVLPADGSPGCGIRLERAKTIGGRVATPAPECSTRIKPLADAAAWFLSDGIVFIDATRKRVMKFEEDETAIPASPSVAEPKYYLVPTVAGVTHLPRADDLVGTWRLAKGGGKACTVTFERGNRKAGDTGPIRIEPGCRLAGLPSKLRSWRMEAIHLMLESDEDGVVFDQTGGAAFASTDGGFKLSR